MQRAILFLFILLASAFAIVDCGDGYCDDWYYGLNNSEAELCSSCPQDCACPASEICDPESYNAINRGMNGCASLSACGDGYCEPYAKHTVTGIAETCVTCPKDCGCFTDPKQGGGPNNFCSPGLEQADGRGCVHMTYCGDSVCQFEPDAFQYQYRQGFPENCENCVEDCGCDEGLICDLANATGMGCRYEAICGNSICDTDEDCSCQEDCPCAEDEECVEVGEEGNYAKNICMGEDTQYWQPCADGSGKACLEFCGDGYCETMRGEDCASCGKDCGCGKDSFCMPGSSADAKGCLTGEASAEPTTSTTTETSDA